jgi:putative PIG3 family NAD(P)H quinone oxidoreductase
MLPENMRTVEISEPGEPSVLVTGERPLPVPGTGQVLIKAASIGVNGPDIMQRRGLYPPPQGASDLLGLEVSGTVVAVGENSSRWKVGDAICALCHGGAYAEYVAIDEDHCLPVPDSVSLEDAGGLPETYFTVWSNLFLDHPVKKDGLLLVHGGAGGIGTTAIQLGAALGMRVFTTCSNVENMAFCEGLGAEKAINYREEDFVEVVREAGGADLIVDIVGGDYIERNMKAAAPDARMVQLAFRTGSRVEVNLMPIMLKRLTITGSTLRSRPPEFKARIAKDLEDRAWPLFSAGKLKALTHAVLPLEDAADAHRMMEAATHRGKILLVP